ncbi:MAG: hypothetical protein IKG15_02285 [Solobacterium sp.]|nr:hypothetical protein [Solobacterium sp.]
MAEIQVQKKIMIRGRLQKVWDTVIGVNKYGWRSNVLRIVVLNDSCFEEYDTEELITRFEITDYEKNASLDLEFENAEWFGHCTMLFEEEDDYTVLEVILETRSRKLTLAPILKKTMEKRMEQYLADLRCEIQTS